MGGNRRVFALVGAALLLAGLLGNSWWSVSESQLLLQVGLRKFEVCMFGICQSVGYEQFPGQDLFRLFASATFFIGLGCIAVCLASVLIEDRIAWPGQDTVPARLCILVGLLALGTFLSFSRCGLQMCMSGLSWGFFATAGGSALLYAAVRMEESAAPGGGASWASPGLPARRPPSPTPVQASEVRQPTDLRFAARKCDIGPKGLSWQLEQGGWRGLTWDQVASLSARQMPAHTPCQDAIFVDVAPHDGAPLRLLASTQVNYEGTSGGPAGDASENLRQLAAYIRQRNPAVIIEPESAAFFSQGQIARRFAALREFSEYEARYD